MFALIARFDVDPGSVEEFDRIARVLVTQIQAEEPGTILYPVSSGQTKDCSAGSVSGESTRAQAAMARAHKSLTLDHSNPATAGAAASRRLCQACMGTPTSKFAELGIIRVPA